MIPNLATEWDVNTDELSITWTLREGVNFADGEPFNAEAVKRNIEEYQANNRTETANIAECQIIDDTHIKMMMAEPNSSTLESVGFFVYYMSPKALENPSSLDAATCGTGPFQLSEFENNAYAIYTKNENYWKEGLPYLDSVEVTLVTESSTASTAFQANEYDMYWVGLANPTILQQLDGAGIYVKEDNQNGMGVESLGLIPNSAIDGPWADARVRRALCYAIDVDAINAAFLMGMAQMTDQWAVPGSATYNDSLNHFTYDPEKAKELLVDAGYADGFDLEITVPSSYSQHVDSAQIIADELSQVGVNVTLNQVEWSTWLQDVYKGGNFQATVIGFDGTLAPSDWLKKYVTDDAKNFMHYSNTEYDDVFNTAYTTVDDDVKVENYKKAQMILAEDAAAVYIEDPANLVAVSKKFGGYTFYPTAAEDMSLLYQVEQ